MLKGAHTATLASEDESWGISLVKEDQTELKELTLIDGRRPERERSHDAKLRSGVAIEADLRQRILSHNEESINRIVRNKFTCIAVACMRGFPTLKKLARHVTEQHIGFYICELCSGSLTKKHLMKSFSTPDDLKSHLMSALQLRGHGLKKGEAKAIVDRSEQSQADLKQGLIDMTTAKSKANLKPTASKKASLNCYKCQEEFPTKWRTQVHALSHASHQLSKYLSCGFCEKYYAKFSVLKNHLIKIHCFTRVETGKVQAQYYRRGITSVERDLTASAGPVSNEVLSFLFFLACRAKSKILKNFSKMLHNHSSLSCAVKVFMCSGCCYNKPTWHSLFPY